MARGDAEMRIRVPEDVKEWLADEARRNLRSQTAQIVIALRSVMAGEHGVQSNSPAGSEAAAR